MDAYARHLPVDRNTHVMQEYPPATSAIGTLTRDNASVSSVTALNANTTVIEVGAVTVGAAIRWASSNVGSVQGVSVITAASGANFDHFIPVNQVRKFVVPRVTTAIPNYNNQGSPSIVGLNTQEGLFANLATISAGTGSVFLTQY